MNGKLEKYLSIAIHLRAFNVFNELRISLIILSIKKNIPVNVICLFDNISK